MRRYKYGSVSRDGCCDKNCRNVSDEKLENIRSMVDDLRASLDNISEVLSEITELSAQVTSEIEAIDDAVTNIEVELD